MQAFVEDINNILNSGEVPNMFAADEKMQVKGTVQCLSSFSAALGGSMGGNLTTFLL
jgi:hypothetical protein